MNKEQKQKLLKYLYPTQEAQEFMCNDLYQELLQIIKASECISSKNIVNETRKKNLEIVNKKIKKFLENNINYLNMIKKIYPNRNVEDIIIGFVFFVSNTDKNCLDTDIFKDKKSICYTQVSIMDVI